VAGLCKDRNIEWNDNDKRFNTMTVTLQEVIEDIKDICDSSAEARAAELPMKHREASRAVELLEADKDGRVVVLPCKLGDVVYRNCNPYNATPFTMTMTVKEIRQDFDIIHEYAPEFLIQLKEQPPRDPRYRQLSEHYSVSVPLAAFGVYVFLDKYQAEAALANYKE
jgi:hypothetical protein